MGPPVKLVELADYHGIIRGLSPITLLRYYSLAILAEVALDLLSLVLRGHANSLYFEAALHLVQDLNETQQAVIATITKAEEKLRTTESMRAFLDVVADVLALAAATCAGKPAVIVAALNEVREDLSARKKV